jgi:Sigma-70, region 4
LLALNEGPFDINEKIEEAGSYSLLQEISRSLASFGEREGDILARRMGLCEWSETLQQIGDDYRVTRERIRQIESKSLAKLALLLGREFPLPILGLEAVDPWFKGIGKAPFVLEYILTSICDKRVSVLRIEGVDYVGHLNQEDWERASKEARRILAASSGDEVSEEHCRTLVGSLIPDAAREFKGALWQMASVLCHFVERSDGSRVLASYGRGADQLVEAVLSEAERPLHYSEIATRAAQRSGKEVDIRRIHNAAAATGILLGRGIYGLKHHIKISDADASVMRDELEQVILDGPNERQWHNYELLSVMAERDIPGAGDMDKYLIDVVLARSHLLQRLGRMTWTKRSVELVGTGNRIDLRQAIVALLQKAGGPLSANESRQRLVALRGVNEHFQISSCDQIVRGENGSWGLNDRDIVLKRAHQPAAVEHLIMALLSRGRGIHLSEVTAAMIGGPTCDIAPATLFAIASQGGSARRESISAAVLACLREAQEPLSIDAIVMDVQKRIKRPCDRRKLSSCLQALEACFDPGLQRWSLPAVLEEEDELVIDTTVPSHQNLPTINWTSR